MHINVLDLCCINTCISTIQFSKSQYIFISEAQFCKAVAKHLNVQLTINFHYNCNIYLLIIGFGCKWR